MKSKVLFIFMSLLLVVATSTVYATKKSNGVIQVSPVNDADNFLWTDQAKKIGDREYLIFEYKRSVPPVRRLAVLADTKNAIILSYFLMKFNAARIGRGVFLREGMLDNNNAPGKVWATFPYWGHLDANDWNSLGEEDQKIVLHFYKITKKIKEVVMLEARTEPSES